MNNNMDKTTDTVTIETPPSIVGQSARGKYKYEVLDKNGVVYDSGEWKPNLILDCGLDKLADMPWAQTFQWCVAGTDPTPTVEKFDHTRLKVTLDLFNTCDNPEPGYVFPDGRKLECWEEDMPAIRARAVDGCREAPELPLSYDPARQLDIKNVPENAEDHLRSFGKVTEIGSTLYLRDQNLQFKVIGSCPQYLVEPLQATAEVVAISGFCSTLGAVGAPSANGHSAANPPPRDATTGIFTEAYDVDGDGLIDFVDRGLVATHRTRIGQGYVGLAGNKIGKGDPEVPLFDETGAADSRSGIRVDFPQGRGGKLKVSVATKIDSTGVKEGDLELIDQGDGYGFSDDCEAGTPLITFEAPSHNAHWGPWTADDDNSWNKQMYYGQYTQRYGGLLRSAGRAGPIRYGHQFGIEHETTAWDGTMWSTHGSLANLTQDVYEHCFGDGTEPKTDSSFPMGYGENVADQQAYDSGRFWPTVLPAGVTPTTNKLNVTVSQIMLMHFLPFAGPNGHHWYNSPAKVKPVDSQSSGYDKDNVATRDSVVYFMKESKIGTGAGQVPTDNWKIGYPLYHANTQNIGVGNIKAEIRASDNSDGLAVSSGVRFSDPGNDTLMTAIEGQWSTNAGLKAAIQGNDLGLIDVTWLQKNLDPSPVYLPVESIKNLGFKHEAYHNNPDGPQIEPGGAGGELQKVIESWTALNGAFSLGHFEPNTEYDFLARRTGNDSYFLYQGNASDYNAYGAEPNLFHRMAGAAKIEMAIAFTLVTNDEGIVRWIKIDPKAWMSTMLNDQLEAQTNDRHKGTLENIVDAGALGSFSKGRLYAGNFYQASDPRMITPSLPQRRPAVAEAEIKDCKVTKVTVTENGRGYTLGDTPNVVMTAPEVERAEVEANIDPKTGWITSFTVTNPGKGYSCSQPAKINFPRPPIQPVRAWDLLVKPIKTYENINNDYAFKRLEQGIQDDIFREQNCDIYHTQQTYLGDGKSHFSQGTVTSGPADGGHYSQSKVRCGPCHYVEYGGPSVNGTKWRANPGGGNNVNLPGSYTISEEKLFDNDLSHVEPVDKIYHNQYKTHGWYLTGTDPETNSLYCGTDFLSTGNQVIMTRTFDFYMELQPVTYTEIGFKEAPAARELFSRIVFDDPIRLRAGQYLRVSYQLLLTMEPGPTARYREVPSEGTWVNGRREFIDNNTGDRAVTPVLTGYECIQGNGIAVVGGDGVATPYDITGVANEPYAAGTYFLGPQYGYVNRWKNGDTRLSYPTREYNRDINNPWIHGGDQHNPPDWAIRHFRSPTQNYIPRNFRTFLEWPAFTKPIPKGWANGTFNGPQAPVFEAWEFPPGPESTLERDAFSHWYVPWFSNGNEGVGAGHITWTNYVANYQGGDTGRWDFHVTKPYLREIYPDLMRGGLGGVNNYGSHGMPSPEIPEKWIQKYEQGHFLGTDGVNDFYSGVGCYPEPVIQYDGQPGALHDPTTTSTTNKNPLSHLGGMGLITRATFLARNPYTGSTDLGYGLHGKDSFTMLLPHNNGYSGQVVGSTTPSTDSSVWMWKDCGDDTPDPNDTTSYLDWQSNNGGINAVWDTNGTRIGPWCWYSFVDKIKDSKVFGPFDLTRRQGDRWSMHNRYDLRGKYPTRNSYGGGFSSMASWKTWTHTPLINVISNWRGGTPVSVPGLVNPTTILPDTVGNWAQSEVIPVAGCSAFITTSNRDFGIVGSYLNLSHTVFGAVSGLSAEPVHDFGLGQPISTEARSAQGWRGRKITLEEAVDTDGNGFVRSFEVPTYLNDYVRGDHKREKYAEWETSFANLTGVCAMGLGPTSTTLQPIEMTDAARFNSYVFKFGTPTGLVNRFDNLTTFKLKSTFLHTWYRDLT